MIKFYCLTVPWRRILFFLESIEELLEQLIITQNPRSGISLSRAFPLGDADDGLPILFAIDRDVIILIRRGILLRSPPPLFPPSLTRGTVGAPLELRESHRPLAVTAAVTLLEAVRV